MNGIIELSNINPNDFLRFHNQVSWIYVIFCLFLKKFFYSFLRYNIYKFNFYNLNQIYVTKVTPCPWGEGAVARESLQRTKVMGDN